MAAASNKAEKSYLASAVDSVQSISPWGAPRSSTPKPRTESGTVDRSGLKNQQGEDHSTHRFGGISSRRYPDDCPKAPVRWFYATDIPKRKPNLLPPGSQAPADNKPPVPPKKFMTFSAKDSAAIETAHQKLVEEEYDRSITQSRGRTNGSRSAVNTAESDDAQNLDSWRSQKQIPVLEDYLFDVDLSSFELAPAYWIGPVFEVRRGSWFYQDGKPCEENLAYQLEEGYLKVKPFRFPKPIPKEKAAKEPKSSMYSVFGTSRGRGGSGSAEITPRGSMDSLRGESQVEPEPTSSGKESPPNQQAYRLFGTYMNSVVTYQDSTIAWLSTDNLMSSVFQRFAPGGYGAVKVIRGYTEPESKEAKKPKSESETIPTTPNTAHPSTQRDPGLKLDEKQQTLLKRRSAPPSTTSESTKEAKDAAPESRAEILQDQMSVLTSDNTADIDEAARKRDEKEIQNDYDNEPGEEQGRPIDHLILVTHGIGQKLGYRTSGVNFVHDVNIFRKTLKSVFADSADLQALNADLDRLPNNCRIQVLPVCWRHLLDFPRQGVKNRRERDLGDVEEEEEEYPSLPDITVDGVPFVRSLVTDVALDILLYQSPYYKDHISNIVLKECNRVFNLFLQRNPEFNGKVSLAGHSLGSAILFDILCSQSEDVKVHESSHRKYPHRSRPKAAPKRQSKDFELDFEVDSFFALGSPIGLFQMLGGFKVASRHSSIEQPSRENKKKSDFMDDQFLAQPSPRLNHSDNSTLPFSVSAPKCSQLYNIFYSSDPISYRIEPLVAPAMATLKPQPLPYTKKGMFATSASQGLTGIGTKMGQSVSGLFASLGSGIANSLLNRSLGLTGEDVASMNAPQIATQRVSPPVLGAGTNISGGGVIPVPALSRSETAEKKRQLAADTANADRGGNGERAPTLIDSDIETLYAGFEKTRKSQASEGGGESNNDWSAEEEKSKRLRKEELKIRALNQSGRIDFAIQESLIEFNPLSTFASHLMYWQDEDLSHFVASQLLSARRSKVSDKGEGAEQSVGDGNGRDRRFRNSGANWI